MCHQTEAGQVAEHFDLIVLLPFAPLIFVYWQQAS